MSKKIYTDVEIVGSIIAHDIDAGEGSIFAGSHPLGTSAEVVNVVIGTSETPPVNADACPNGTLYIQYID